MIDRRLYRLTDGCDITIQRNNQKLTIPVKLVRNNRKKTKSPHSFSAFRKISDETGYVKLDELKKDEIPVMFDSLKHTKGIIWDLRSYPVVYFHDILLHLATKQDYEYLQFTYSDLSHPGAFYNKQLEIISYKEEEIANSRNYKGKIVVLISEITFSCGETSAVVYRTAGKATLIGRPTAGANGDLAQLLLPGNVKVYFSGLGAYYPDRTESQRKGVIPDIEVYPTMQSVLDGKTKYWNVQYPTLMMIYEKI
jgi:C-terminal processing protease CtpA/Prc